MEGKGIFVVEMERKVEELGFRRRATMEDEGMEGKKWDNPRSKIPYMQLRSQARRPGNRPRPVWRPGQLPSEPAWEPAEAGLEAGVVPERAGLRAGRGQAGGRGTSRASRPGSRPGPGQRPAQPRKAQFSPPSSNFACFDLLDFRALCIIRNSIEQQLCDPGKMQNMM